MPDDPVVAERGVLTASAEAWDLAVHRADVIRGLAAQRVVGLEAADAAAAQLGMSRRQVYVLVGRWRAGEGVASDLLPGMSSGGRGGGRLPPRTHPHPGRQPGGTPWPGSATGRSRTRRQGTMDDPDEDGELAVMSPEDAARWYAARTLADLGELTALWLEGKIRSQPCYADPDPGEEWGQDPETRDLVPVLAAANRAGYFTDTSQPGEPPAIGYNSKIWVQRAGVTGYASTETLAVLRGCAATTPLILMAIPSAGDGAGDGDWDHRIAVTLNGETENTWFGGLTSRSSLREMYEDDLHPDAVQAMCDAWQVTIIDPEWGRNDVLWPMLGEFAAQQDHGLSTSAS